MNKENNLRKKIGNSNKPVLDDNSQEASSIVNEKSKSKNYNSELNINNKGSMEVIINLISSYY